MFNTRHIMPAIQSYPVCAANVRYGIEVAGCNNPLADSMRPYTQRLMGTVSLGAKTLELLKFACQKFPALLPERIV
jgi:hypothetical protein